MSSTPRQKKSSGKSTPSSSSTKSSRQSKVFQMGKEDGSAMSSKASFSIPAAEKVQATTSNSVVGEPSFAIKDKNKVNALAELFSFFDHDCDGKLGHHELARILREKGFNPSEEEVAGMIVEYDSDKDGMIDFDEFLKLLPNVKHEGDSYAEIYEAFRFFDQDKNGLIKSARMKAILTSHGEKLTDKEAMEFISFALGGKTMGDIDYREVVMVLLGLKEMQPQQQQQQQEPQKPQPEQQQQQQ